MFAAHVIHGIFWVLLVLVVLPKYTTSSYPPQPSSSYPNPAFVPAMPGKTPKCLKDPRLTFCLNPYEYPKQRILYLLENKMYDVDTFLQDETRDTYVFEARDARTIPMTYGNNNHPDKSYLPPRNANNSYSSHRRPSKFGTPHHMKPYPPSVSPQSTYFNFPSNTTPPLNSFSPSYPNKYDEPHRYNYNDRRTTSQDNSFRPYPRYPKNRYRATTAASYLPPEPQHMWWRKTLRRQKRQAGPDVLCATRTSYIMPRAAQSVEGSWMYLVNVDQRYQQLVKSETCLQNTCEGGCDVPQGFSAICQQKYVQKRLVALDGSGSKLNSDIFWFPSCCVCRIRSNGG